MKDGVIVFERQKKKLSVNNLNYGFSSDQSDKNQRFKVSVLMVNETVKSLLDFYPN